MEQVKLKYLCSSYSTPITQDQIQEAGNYKVYGASGQVGFLAEPGCKSDYLGIIKDGAGVGRISTYEASSYLLGTMAYIVPNLDVDINWLKYAVMSLNLSESISKTTIPHIYFSEYGNRKVSWCTIEEQRSIAVFLDCKCAEIDSVIAATQRTIEEYKKLKQSIITEAVTKGVRGKRTMKDSGIEWFCEIPEEWATIPSKFLFRNSDLLKQPGDEQLTASQKYGIISQREYMERENTKIVLANKGLEDWKHVEPYDFVISLRSFQGGLEMSETTGCITWHYIVLKPRKTIVSKYFKWLFKSEIYIKALQRTCNFIRDGQDLRYSNFVQVPLFEPSLDEQQEIADYLDQKCSGIDALIAKKERFLVEMENYKKSLIYEYVTGKKEVPVCQ